MEKGPPKITQGSRTAPRSAGFPTCCIADFQIGGTGAVPKCAPGCTRTGQPHTWLTFPLSHFLTCMAPADEKLRVTPTSSQSLPNRLPLRTDKEVRRSAPTKTTAARVLSPASKLAGLFCSRRFTRPPQGEGTAAPRCLVRVS
jgi:hypothetical protein